MENLLNLAIKSIFIENMALAFFLGMCSFLACSRKVDTAIGLGVAVIFVQVMTVPMNNLIMHYLLVEGALAWIHRSHVAGSRSPVHQHHRGMTQIVEIPTGCPNTHRASSCRSPPTAPSSAFASCRKHYIR